MLFYFFISNCWQYILSLKTDTNFALSNLTLTARKQMRPFLFLIFVFSFFVSQQPKSKQCHLRPSSINIAKAISAQKASTPSPSPAKPEWAAARAQLSQSLLGEQLVQSARPGRPTSQFEPTNKSPGYEQKQHFATQVSHSDRGLKHFEPISQPLSHLQCKFQWAG